VSVNLDGKTVVVTGGAGFIGSHIVGQLIERGARVRVFDNMSSGYQENLSDLQVEFISGDVLDQAALLAAATGADLLCHQAAQLEITKALDDPVSDLRVNIEGTVNVLEAARRLQIDRVVFASSACVYGQAKERPQAETHPTEPNWAYGVSKLAAEQYGRLYADEFGIAVSALRYSIVYGPREWYGRVLPIFLKRAVSGEAPVVFGEGDQERDFVFVDDVARLNIHCLEDERPGFRVYNASTGVATSIAQLGAIVAETFKTPDVIFEDVKPGERSNVVEQNRMRLPSELQVMHMSAERAATDFGWRAEIPLHVGLAEELAWYRDNPGRWQTLSY
jgi:UDP-glucose 4-epimerase